MVTPDPTISANLYCDRGLDGLLIAVLRPFIQKVRMESDAAGGWRMWFVRYSRRGDHLKVRLHGSREEATGVRQSLAEAAEGYYGSLPPRDETEPRISRFDAPPIDEEDEEDDDHPDRTIRFTRYRRSHVSLGPRPFIDDDGYTARMVACLSAGAETSLDALASAPDARGLPAIRQRVLLKALIGGLAVLPIPVEERTLYLGYHRDWLLRFYADDDEKEAEVRDRFELQLQGMRPTAEQLRQVAAARWRDDGAEATDPLGYALRDLHDHLREIGGDPAYSVDPFAPNPTFPPIFKVFHGIANQLGLSAANEAFVHHLLLSSVGTEQLAGHAAAFAAARG